MMSKKNLKTSLYKIAIYTRVSTEEQAENPEGSIKNQELRIRDYVKLKNMVEPFGEIKDVFCDPGVSAKDMKRPAFQRMLAAIQKKEITMVIVTELSRFSRSTKDFTMLQEFLDEHDCKFLSLRENFDTSGASGSMVMNLMASIAEFERRQTAERISNSFLARAKRGLYNGGSVPIGYRINSEKPGYLFVEPNEVEIVRTAFEAFLKIGTLAKTAKFLTANKIFPPRKVQGSGSVRCRNFTVDSLYRLLKNKAYIGIKTYQTKQGVEEVPAVWESIIDKDLFNRVGKRLASNKSHKRTHGINRYPYILSGLIFCDQCRLSMSGKSAYGHKRKVGYYEHIKHARLQSGLNEKLPIHDPHRVPSEKLEPVVWQEVKKFIQSDRFALELLDRAKAMQKAVNAQDESAKLKQKIKNTAAQIEVLAERIALLPKGMDVEPLIAQMTKLQDLKIDLEQKSVEQKGVTNNSDELINFTDLTVFRKGLKSLIEKGENNKDIQSAIIKKVVHKIYIKPDGFEIHFHVGRTYYLRESGDQSSDSLFFSFEPRQNKTLNPSASAGAFGSRQNFNFFKDRRSSLLTNGEPSLSIDERLQSIDFIQYSNGVRLTINSQTAQEVSLLYQNGLSVSDISKQLGFSKCKVLRLMKSVGLKSRPRMAHAEKDRFLKHGKQSALPYYGFCYFEGRVTKDPKEFPTLQIIYNRVSSGRTIQQIVLELNKKKLPSRKGKAWSWAAVQNIVNRIKDKKIIFKNGGDYELR